MSNLSSLQGKVAVITGSTQGVGEATARLFKERGVSGMIISGRNQERGEAVATSLTGDGCQAYFLRAELDNVDQCRALIAAADQHFGKLDILVNCAAQPDRCTIWDATPELFDKIMAVNVRAPFFLIQDAVKLMERDRIAGSIINISSVSSYGSVPMLSVYASSKGALNILTKNIAYAVMHSHIRVNSLNIGWMDSPGENKTQRHYHSDGQDWLAQAEATQPFGRLLKTDEVARAVAFLASDESGLMTGSIVDFDQSVMGAGPQPVPPPVETWAKVAGIRYE